MPPSALTAGSTARKRNPAGLTPELPLVYARYMDSTTVKVSVATRERLRALGGATYEDTISEALDVLEADRFWAQAEAAAACRSSLSVEQQQEIVNAEAAVDRAFDGIS